LISSGSVPRKKGELCPEMINHYYTNTVDVTWIERVTRGDTGASF